MKRIISRTIVTIKATVKYVNTESYEFFDEVVCIPVDVKEEDYVSFCDTKENCKALKIVSVERIEQLYAMDEEDFIKYARPVEKRYQSAKETEEK